MKLAIAFDVYGTLIDTDGVLQTLNQLIGEKAAAFARTWRAQELPMRSRAWSAATKSAASSRTLSYTRTSLKLPGWLPTTRG